MAKGFGAIMSAADLATRQRAGATCPVCGDLMEHNGAGYFCHNPADIEWLRSDEVSAAAWEAFDAGIPVSYADIGTPRHRRQWDPQMQGLILAVVPGDQGANERLPGVEWLLMTVRGYGGRTVIKMSWEGDRDQEPAHPPASDEWLWAEWTGRGES